MVAHREMGKQAMTTISRHQDEWTEPRLELLAGLKKQDKLSYENIAVEINKKTGSNFTKNAVCGRLHRLFGPLPKKTEAEKEATRRASRELENERRRQKRVEARQKEGLKPQRIKRESFYGDKPEPFAVHAQPEIETFNLRFEQLTEETCKWPLEEEGPFTFCGRLSYRGKPYCIGHCRIAYQPPSSRNNGNRIEYGRGRGGVFGTGRAA